MIKYLGIAFCFLIGASCTNNAERETFKEFPATIDLQCEIIKTTPNLYAVGGMLLLDSILITVDIKADTFFQVFHLPEYDYIGGYVTKGSGPNEEVFIDPFIKALPQNSFYFKTATKIKTMTFDTEKGALQLVSQTDIPDLQLSSDKRILDKMWHVFKINDSFIGSVDHSKKEFVGINTNTAEIFDFGADYPNVGRKIDPLYKSMLFAKANIVKPDGSAFASVYDKFPILRIYSTDGKLVKEIWYENNQSFPEALINNKPSEYSVNEMMLNYMGIKSSNRYIYALYVGKKHVELGAGLHDDFTSEIHVWDWNGTPVYKLLLDKKIFSFDVDKNDSYLICTSLNSLDELYKYTLK